MAIGSNLDRHYVPDWAQDERAKTLSRETWNGILERLEKTQPGCTEGVVGR